MDVSADVTIDVDVATFDIDTSDEFRFAAG